MIAISDVFDALRSRRVYGEPKPMEVIREMLLAGRGTSFNPFLVDNFVELIINPEKAVQKDEIEKRPSMAHRHLHRVRYTQQ